MDDIFCPKSHASPSVSRASALFERCLLIRLNYQGGLPAWTRLLRVCRHTMELGQGCKHADVWCDKQDGQVQDFRWALRVQPNGILNL